MKQASGPGEARAAALPLPSHRHLPGRNGRHEAGAFDFVPAQCADETREASVAENTGWHYGLRLFREGYFWEAHEVLETVWMRAAPNGRERHLVQGVIHLANGALKNGLAQQGAAKRLAVLALDAFGRAFAGGREQVMGLRHEALRHCGERIAAGEENPELSDS
ncbi:MAG: DUF309 domain-containing protein [Nitratireductor sp.]|nr:DUF309 domain-containing protein [Nitratireductor sp.]